MRQGRFLSVSAQYLYWINIDYCRLETGTSFFVFRFEIVQFGQWIFIHDKEKIQALPTHWQARLKMYIMNRCSAYIECNTHRFFHYYFFFVLPFSIIFLPMIFVCSLLIDAVEIFSFFTFYQTSNHNSHIQAKIFSLKDGRKCISSCLFSKLKDQASLINVNTHRSKFSIQNFYSKSC